jgi:hypothetical protein
MVNGGFSVTVEHLPGVNGGIDQPVVAAFHALADGAFQVGDRILQNRRAILRRFRFNALEPIFPWAKGLRKCFIGPGACPSASRFSTKGCRGTSGIQWPGPWPPPP